MFKFTTKAQYISDWRDLAQMTQSDLAEAAGTTEATISRIESGKIKYTQAKLESIAGALGIPVYQLLLPPAQVRSIGAAFAAASAMTADPSPFVSDPKPNYSIPPSADDE